MLSTCPYTTNCSSSVLPINHINHFVLFSISKESIVDIEGTVQAAEQKIQSCSQSDVEIVVTKVQLSRCCAKGFLIFSLGHL